MCVPDLTTRFVITEELILAECEESHADELFARIDQNRSYLREWFPWLDQVKTAEDSLHSIQRTKQLRNQRQELALGVFLRGKLAGRVATHVLDWLNRKTTLGYWLGQESSGQGLMVYCCRRLLEYLFDELRFHRVGIHCATKNHRSRRVAEKLGFCEKGILKDSEWLYDHFVDHVIYAMLDSEFRSLRETEGWSKD